MLPILREVRGDRCIEACVVVPVQHGGQCSAIKQIRFVVERRLAGRWDYRVFRHRACGSLQLNDTFVLTTTGRPVAHPSHV